MKNLIPLLFLLLATKSFSQDVYYASSLIMLNGDTVKGYISNIYDYKTISFKRNKNGKPMLFTPKQLRGFILDGNTFISKVVTMPQYIHQNTMDGVSFLTKDLSKKDITDSVFLQQTIKGLVSLYRLKTPTSLTYYFAEKYDIFKEIPPQFNIVVNDSFHFNKMPTVPELMSTRYTRYEINDYLDTLAYFLEDKTFVKSKSNFKPTEKNLTFALTRYNKKNGYQNGGIIKSEVSKKWFWGVNAGIIALGYDQYIEHGQPKATFAFKAYGLLPLVGISRYSALKIGYNYFTYRTDNFQRNINSASVGLRYTAISGFLRPYFEASVAAALQVENGTSGSIDGPLLLELGTNIPIKNFFITVGATASPILLYKLNGYKLWSFNVGIMF